MSNKHGESDRVIYAMTRQKWFEKILGNRDQQLLEMAIDVAFAGDKKMLQFLLSKTLPANVMDDFVKVSGLLAQSDSEKVDKVFEAMDTQQITPKEADILMGCIQKKVQIHEMTDVEKRINALEAAYTQGIESIPQIKLL